MMDQWNCSVVSCDQFYIQWNLLAIHGRSILWKELYSTARKVCSRFKVFKTVFLHKQNGLLEQQQSEVLRSWVVNLLVFHRSEAPWRCDVCVCVTIETIYAGGGESPLRLIKAAAPNPHTMTARADIECDAAFAQRYRKTIMLLLVLSPFHVVKVGVLITCAFLRRRVGDSSLKICHQKTIVRPKFGRNVTFPYTKVIARALEKNCRCIRWIGQFSHFTAGIWWYRLCFKDILFSADIHWLVDAVSAFSKFCLGAIVWNLSYCKQCKVVNHRPGSGFLSLSLSLSLSRNSNVWSRLL